MNKFIEKEGALVNENGVETPPKDGDFALVNPDENTSTGTRETNPSR